LTNLKVGGARSSSSILLYPLSVSQIIETIKMSHFSTFPSPPKLEAKPFTVAIPEADVAELKSLLKVSRLGPSTPTNSNPSDHSLGVSMDWLKNAKQVWETSFDW
jgi:microsomal epoxide hydrolase